jgi:hypothetical protein
MSREKLLRDIQDAYRKWQAPVEFTSEDGASPEDESKIMDEILTLVEKNKQ